MISFQHSNFPLAFCGDIIMSENDSSVRACEFGRGGVLNADADAVVPDMARCHLQLQRKGHFIEDGNAEEATWV